MTYTITLMTLTTCPRWPPLSGSASRILVGADAPGAPGQPVRRGPGSPGGGWHDPRLRGASGGADEGYITNIAVRPEYRRQGIAADILGVFENFARGNHLAFLTLEVRASNTAARSLYGKLGYLQTGARGYYEHPGRCHHYDIGV